MGWSGQYVTAVMVAMELLEVGLNTVSKAAMTQGMSHFVFVFYSNAFAFFLLLSSSLIFYRNRSLPQLTCSIICRIFLIGLISCGLQLLMYFGLGYSSPSLASAMTNLTPAFTFMLAMIFRMEKLEFSMKSNQAKAVGTITSICGALILTIYKGPPIPTAPILKSLLFNNVLSLPPSNWIIGGFSLAAHSFFLAFLFIFRTLIIRDYPAELMVSLLCCIFVTVLSAIVSLTLEHDPSAWRLRPNLELLAIGYSAVFGVAFRSVIHTWVLRMKGPVYVSMFKPFGLVIALFVGVIYLGDVLYLGSMVGAAIITLGFYFVIWGQAQQEKMAQEGKTGSFKSASSSIVPLLQTKSTEI